MEVSKVMDEIYAVDKDLQSDYEKLKQEAKTIEEKAEKIRPSEIWKNIPIVNWIMYDSKMR